MHSRMSMVRVVLVDDQSLVRNGFRLILEKDERIEVVGEADDGVRAVYMAKRMRPDVVLMDIRMPRADGIEATRTIVNEMAKDAPSVLVLTTFDLDEYVFQALRAGASGFLLKDIEPKDLRAAVHTIADGGGLLAPSVTKRLIAKFAGAEDHQPKAPERLDFLTEREREVMVLVSEGLDNQEIGERLFISPATVKTHVSRTITKLNAGNRANLVVIAYETGLVGGRRGSGL